MYYFDDISTIFQTLTTAEAALRSHQLYPVNIYFIHVTLMASDRVRIPAPKRGQNPLAFFGDK